MEEKEEKPVEKQQTTDEKIASLYLDKGGFGSLKDTYNDVKRKYPEIKLKDVQAWYRKNVDFNILQRGQNSFVAQKPHQEYQLDLFNMKGRDLEYTMGVACIDVFSKFATVVALADKKPETLLEAIRRIFQKMGAKPLVLMSDEEGSLQSKLADAYLKREKVKYIINRNHSPFVERFIRTFRNLVRRRLQKRPEEKWYDLLFEVLSIYNYKMVHRMTDLKPSEAVKRENFAEAKMNMEHHAKHERRYGEIKVGDRVRLFRKRTRLGEKEEVPVWSKNAVEVLRIETDPVAGQLFYVAGSGEKPYIRSQVLKV